MMDTMTMTKIVGGFCGALLVFLLGKWLAETVYEVGADSEGGQAYTIEVAADTETAPVVDEGPSFAEIYANADPAAGEGLFRPCSACHVVVDDGSSKPGPQLQGIVGREVASVEGYNYSGSLVAVVDVWTPEALNGFLEDPRTYAPGTAMRYGGMRDIEDRANLIAWLDSLDN